MKEAFIETLSASLRDGGFVRLVLGRPTERAGPIRKILGRLIVLRGAPTLSLTEREDRRDTTRNLPLDAVPEWAGAVLGEQFGSALLETTRRDWQLSMLPGRPPRLNSHAPRAPAAPPRDHDQPKRRALDAGAADWLHALGLASSSGAPLPSRAAKVQQIHRYSEILGHLLDEIAWPKHAPVRAVDMGCGKGALTFAAWQLLRRQRGHDAHVIGVEADPRLAAEAEAIARKLGLEGLSFRAGAIADVPLDAPDILVALHACNTATDDAIRRGIASGARLLLVAPCCHQEIRPQLGSPAPFTGALKHGLFAERMAEWVTDALRALALQWAGYRVKAIEFVSPEHTPRNLLLAAVRSGPPFADPRRREEFESLKAFFGIQRHALDGLEQGGPASPSA